METLMEQKEYLTEKEACDYLGISRGTLFNHVKKKRIRRYEQEAPRLTLYKRTELDSLKEIKPKD